MEGKGEFLDETNRKMKVEKRYNSSPVQFGSSVHRRPPVLDRVAGTTASVGGETILNLNEKR